MKNLVYPKGFKAIITALSLLVMASLWGCEKESIDINTTSDVNMLGYFEERPEQYSSLVTILERTDVAGYLQAYGSFTMFAPTNDAIALYLTEKGVASVDQVDVEELMRLVRFHLIEDTITTSSFTDGKLPRITMLGQYLITGAAIQDGVSRTRVNRQANVVQANIRVGNGVIHAIDRVLQPASQTAAEMLETNPEYSIFTAALKETGLYTELNKLYKDGASTQRVWYTVLAQKDAVYQGMGINNIEDMKARYSNTDNPANKTDGLYLYMAYRILENSKYLADLVTTPSHGTLAPQEVITTKLKGEQVLINEDIFMGVLEPGVELDRSASDNTATNGVVHTVNENFEIKDRSPVRVYFDVADQPEIMRLPEYRKPGASRVLFTGSLQEMYTEGSNSRGFAYNPPPASGIGDGYAYGDYLDIRMSSNVNRLVEFTTPTLVKGKYKVWVGFRRITRTAPLQVYFNDEVLPRTIDMTLYYPTPGTEREKLAQGVKRYTETTGSTVSARLAGTITVETTGRHKIKFIGLTNNNGGHRLDMIQFIPEDEDQLYPKIGIDGSLIYEE